MVAAKKCLILCILFVLIDFHQCRRYGGGGGRRGGGGSPPRPTTRRPYTTSRSYGSTQRQYTSTVRSSNYYPSSSFRPQTTRRPQYGAGTTPNYNNAGYNIPPRPGSNTYGAGQQNIKIVNKYNYHYPGYYSMPVQSHAYPGYFNAPTSYSYSSHDTGSTALGFFLGYSLAKITTPTYSHYSFYDGYRPRYDHYEVHHYYHNKDSIPQKQEIQSNSIVGCVGDSKTICPANTISLCTSNGALMCVVSATSTIPCTTDNRQVNCVTSTITCVNNTAPECKNSQGTTTINIPCISNAQVEGEVKYVNNTIVSANATNAENATVNTTQSSTQYPTTTPLSSTQYPITTTSSSTQYPITTTPSSPVVHSPARKKRDVAQNFCVTIVALPAKKEETEGELFLKDAKSVFENFVESVWNM